MQTLTNICPEKQNTAAALGFFDGIHLGHRKVLALAAKQERCALLPICLTFTESPKAVMSDKPFSYLMTEEDKSFLFSFEMGQPEWKGYEFEYFKDYPSVQWKLLNLKKLAKQNPLKLQEEAEKLRNIPS